MPSNDPNPTIAFLTEVDARAYNGVSIFDMGPGAVTGPAQDYFEDALNFLNGRGSPATWDLDSNIKVVGSGAGTWSMGLDADDRVYIENSLESFTLAPGSGREAYGFTPLGILTSGGVGPFRITASGDWVRGNVENSHMDLDTVLKAGQFFVPSIAFRAQDVITMLRGQALVDADSADRFLNLDQQINAAYDNGVGGQRYRWGVDEVGHVWLAADSATATPPDGAGVWTSDDLQLWLGFDGTEVTQTLADAATGTNLEYIEATYPCQGVLVPSRPMRRPSVYRFEEKTNTARLTSGEIASNKVMGWHSWIVEWYLDGPQDCRDLSTHWLNALVARAPKGVRWAVYQVWGDPRRLRFDVEVRTTQATVVPAYDVLGTSELDGYRGRIRGRRSIGDSAKKANRWPQSIRMRIPMTTTIEAAEE